MTDIYSDSELPDKVPLSRLRHILKTGGERMALINCDRKCRCVCTICSILSSVIFGIVAAILRFRGLIAFSPVFLWSVLAVSVVVLVVVIAALAYGNQLRECKWKCAMLNTLLAGVLGTVLLSILLLGLGCIRSVGLSAVSGGALTAFFALTVTSTACFVKCLALCQK